MHEADGGKLGNNCFGKGKIKYLTPLVILAHPYTKVVNAQQKTFNGSKRKSLKRSETECVALSRLGGGIQVYMLHKPNAST